MLNLSQLTSNISYTKHDEYPRVLQQITFEVVHPSYGQIASVQVWRIVRSQCREDFLEIMDGESQEFLEFATALFNKNGRVKSHLVEPGFRSGTGCWGEELNVGELVYIMDISVKAPVSH